MINRLDSMLISLITTVTLMSGSSVMAVEAFHTETSKELAPAPNNLLKLGTGSGFYSPYAFLVDKKARTLTVWKQLDASWNKIASYPADLGKKEGVKTKRNDARTPEGIYFLQQRMDGAGLDFNLYGKRAFTTNYPNFFDKIEGKTGSGIWLHAVPDKTPLTRGSRGCVVVRNDAIQELTQYVDPGKTPIVISDKLEFIAPEEAAAQAGKIAQSIESWRRAWETKDIDGYMAFYGDGFASNPGARGMHRDAWRAYKQNLNTTYKKVEVKLSKPYIVAYKDRAVARFMQDYASDLHQDFGEKTLYLRREGETFKIIGEEWAESSAPLARTEMDTEAPAGAQNAAKN